MRTLKIFLTILILVFDIYIWNKAISGAPIQITTPSLLGTSFSFEFKNLKPDEKLEKKDEQLKQTIEKSLEGTNGRYSVVIKNLKTGVSYYRNEKQVYDSGSLYKLWVMGEAFEQINQGIISEDEELSKSIESLNNSFQIDPELAEQSSGTITLTVSQALNQMITISHNYAALLLAEKLKLSQVAKYLKDKGFVESKVGTEGESPKTTAVEIAQFYEKLYKGELADPTSTQKMLDLLKNQKLKNKLPAKLPEGVQIAHKTGEIGWFTHDGGIVYSSNGDYIIVVLSESDSPKGAEERIAELSKAVYDFFQTQ